MSESDPQRVLIVDDEAPARDRLRQLLAQLPGVLIAGEAASGDQALAAVQSLTPAVVLLDVRMPGISGLEVARHLALLEQPPAVIFTTAYDAYALQAFEAEAIAYLLKPIRAEKLAAALQRAARLSRPQLSELQKAATTAARSHLAVRTRDGLRLIAVSDIYYCSADQKYTTVRHTGGSDLIEDSLRALEEEFPTLLRVHRNALVNTLRIASIERDAEGQYNVMLQGLAEHIGVSRRLAGELLERFKL
ncbi:MAG: LytTR family DNA-binding domain-containing protein [Steroidobacteraceae bacterium]